MMITMWVNGQDHEVQHDQVIPWVCGLRGALDSVDLGLDIINGSPHSVVTVDVDPTEGDRPGITYLIEVDGVRRELAESWVLPWMHGLAVRHGVDAGAVCDPSAAERAQRVQALMVGHQRGWFTYTGFTHNKRETP